MRLLQQRLHDNAMAAREKESTRRAEAEAISSNLRARGVLDFNNIIDAIAKYLTEQSLLGETSAQWSLELNTPAYYVQDLIKEYFMSVGLSVGGSERCENYHSSYVIDFSWSDD